MTPEEALQAVKEMMAICTCTGYHHNPGDHDADCPVEYFPSPITPKAETK